MSRTEKPFVALAVALSGLAGFVDALAFTSLGGFFASFMSGNSTRLGVGLGTAHFQDAAMAGALIMSFVAGVIVGSVVERAYAHWRQPAVMVGVTLFLTCAAILSSLAPGPLVLLFLASAMGMENSVFTRQGEVSVGLTYMTGTLVRAGQRLAGALMGDADRWGWLRWLVLWLGFVCGVVLGASAQQALRWDALWFAPPAAAALTWVAAILHRRLNAAVPIPVETDPAAMDEPEELPENIVRD